MIKICQFRTVNSARQYEYDVHGTAGHASTARNLIGLYFMGTGST